MNNPHGTIIQIGDILVSEDVVREYFCCDYAACKGVCCIEGDAGAPLDESELPGLEREYPLYSPSMTPAGRDAVALNGFFEIDPEGDIVTPLVPGSGVCADLTGDAGVDSNNGNANHTRFGNILFLDGHVDGFDGLGWFSPERAGYPCHPVGSKEAIVPNTLRDPARGTTVRRDPYSF